jgi:class 3 adenylate cyclase/tetratricopeptide (TPR) repeat protein
LSGAQRLGGGGSGRVAIDAPGSPTRPPAVLGGQERRLVTVLFADLAGFTAAAESMDPEDVHRFLGPLMERLIGTAESYGGTLIHMAGDGFLAVFGAPVAHQDDAERAVRSALAMRDIVRSSGRERPEFAVSDLHAGITTGEVFVVPMRGGIDIVGDTANTAARLVGVAPSGIVLVGERTRAQTGHAIIYREWEPVVLKGKAEPVAAFEAVALADSPHVQARRSPFVGRRSEVVRLTDAFERARADRRAEVAIVSGVPGVGKSRLVAQALTGLDATVLVGRGVPYGDRIPWLALGHGIRAHAGIREDDPSDDARAKLAVAVRAALGNSSDDERDDVERGLAPALGLTTGAEAHRSSGDELNRRIATAVRRFLCGLAASTPLVVVLEDLHWADAQLLAFVRWVYEEPWAASVTIVGLAWPEALGPLGLTTRSHAVITLGPLGRDESDALVRLLLAGDVPAEVAGEVAERASGNPLFLEETLTLLRERGLLREEAGRWFLEGTSRTPVPESVHLVVAARIDGLGVDERRILRDAAVCGRVFSDSQLWALGWREETSGLLPSLAARELIEAEPAPGLGGATFVFKHAVIRDVAYESVPRAERASKHLAVADWLRRRAATGGDEPVELLAYHYGQAAAARLGAAPQAGLLAATYLVRAGDRAAALRAFREAEAWYRQVLEINEPAASGSRDEADRVATEALLKHADALWWLHRFDDARAASNKALLIARAASDERAEAEALLQLGRLDSLRGAMEQARELFTRAGNLFAHAGDARGRARVFHQTAETWRLTDITRMLAGIEEAARLYAAAGDWLAEHVCYEDLAYGCTTRRGVAFDGWFAKSLALVARAGDLRSRAALRRTEGFRSFYRGELRAAVAPLEEAMSLALQTGDAFVETDAAFLLARIRLSLGDRAAAGTLAGLLVRLGEARGLNRTAEEGHVVLARLALREGRPNDAEAHLTTADDFLAAIGAQREGVEVTLARTQIALERGFFAEAAAGAEAYRAEVLAHGDDLEEPVAVMLIARAQFGAGDLERAAALASEANELAGESFHAEVAATAPLLGALIEARSGRVDEARRLLDGAPGADGFPEREAVRAETLALTGNGGWAAAVEAWERLGMTVWLARALIGAGDDEGAAKVLAALGSPLGPKDLAR